MKKVLSLFCLLFTVFTSSASADEFLCKNAYVSTAAAEAVRTDIETLSYIILFSFKDAQGNHHNCGGEINNYVYLKTKGNESVVNAMMSVALTARTNNYRVDYLINRGKRLISDKGPDELSAIQIVEGSPLKIHN